MAEQPYYRPLQGSDFFGDERSARPLVPGTVARQHLQNDAHRFTGKIAAGAAATPTAEAARAASLAGLSTGGLWNTLPPMFAPAPVDFGYADTFPFPITAEGLNRGRERYLIFCVVCHDAAGTGNGRIVQRGYTHPPSYHTDFARGFERRGIKLLLRHAPVGYYFEVVSKGYGAMPDYAAQIPPDDRWKIIAYIRALQFSQRVRLEDLPPEVQQEARFELEKKR